MINYSTINTCFSGLVGYRQTNYSSVPQLSVSLTGSTSGVYVTDVPGITPEFIYDALPPDYPNINAYLTGVTQQETLNAVKDYIIQHKELTKARHLLDNIDVTKHIQYFTDKVTKSGRFVGIEIVPGESDNIAVWIRRLGTQFDTVQSLTIYLFESSQNTAIKTFSLTTTKANSLEWNDLTDWICNYKSTSYGTGQSFYLGYFENSLSGQAVDTLLQGDCCENTWVSNYQKHCSVKGVVFENGALNGTSLPDLKKVGYTNQTFGLHLKISVTCDITETLCDNKLIFGNLAKNKIAMRIFSDYFNSNRVNRNRDISSDRALTNRAMVEEEYKRELKSISFDFTDIDRFCQPCQKNLISVQTIKI